MSLILLLAIVPIGCDAGKPEETCPADYSTDDYVNEYADALCYLAETCPGLVAAVEGMSHEECLASEAQVARDKVDICYAGGGTATNVCEGWDCTRDTIASAAACASASNKCVVDLMFEPHDACNTDTE